MLQIRVFFQFWAQCGDAFSLPQMLPIPPATPSISRIATPGEIKIVFGVRKSAPGQFDGTDDTGAEIFSSDPEAMALHVLDLALTLP